MTQDRRPYWRAYYLANKAAWRGKRWNRTPEQREAYNRRMRDYRAANREAIKVGRCLGIPLAEARILVELASRRVREQQRTNGMAS